MALQMARLSLEMVEALRDVLPRIKRSDRNLADQLARAATSVVLNIAEGDAVKDGNQRARFGTAAGSASESLAAVRVAIAWGYIGPSDADPAVSLLRRIMAGLRKLQRS